MQQECMAELIVALDTQDVTEAYTLAQSLQGTAPWLKVGLELFVQGGPDIITKLKALGFKVFLDLKMYDIPNTVYGGVLSACKMGVDLLTIHTQGGERMARAAMEAVQDFEKNICAKGQTRPLVFGVTVLTSMTQGELPLSQEKVEDLVLDLAQKAQNWGLDGVVCSGHEAAAIGAHCGKSFLRLTPGIRPVSGSADDQRRTMTPQQAVEAGARFLVVGRPITQANIPSQAAYDILQQMQCKNG